MAIKGNELLWAVIVIKNQIMEQVTPFKYLGNTVSKYGNMYLENNFNKMNG
jgi:hypothetical protein